MEKFISVKNLSFEYEAIEPDEKPTPILHNISLEIGKGEFVAILGHNGSGKSTLAKHFNGILLPTKGDVLIDGINTKDEDRLFDIRQKVGMVFQNPDNQLVATIVEDDVAFALENLGVEPEQMRQRVDEALKAVKMYDFRLHSPHQLSGGQKQRVAIAGIIAMRPECIVLDEPTAMLDPIGRREVLKTVRKLNRQYGITIIMITHFMDEAAKSDRVIVVDNGRVLADNIPKKIFSHVEAMRKAGLDVPQVTELCHELKCAGYNIKNDIISEDECVKALLELLK